MFKNYDLKIKNLLKQAHLLIKGDVIGIGFRYWTKKQAELIDISGWVRNKGEEVEMLLQGDEEKINKMIELVKNGPSGSHVDVAEVSWQEPKEMFEVFEIRK